MTTETYAAPVGLIIDTPKGLAIVVDDKTAQVFEVGQIFAPLRPLDTQVIADVMALHRGVHTSTPYRLDDESLLVTRWLCHGCNEEFPIITDLARTSHDLHVARKIAEALALEARRQTCANTQCGVTSFAGDRCPACYGAPS